MKSKVMEAVIKIKDVYSRLPRIIRFTLYYGSFPIWGPILAIICSVIFVIGNIALDAIKAWKKFK